MSDDEAEHAIGRIEVNKIRFSKLITLGSVITLAGVLVTAISGGTAMIWAGSNYVNSIENKINRIDDIAGSIITLSRNWDDKLIVMKAARDKEIASMNDRLDREEHARAELATQMHQDMSDLNRRFDEWLRQRRGEITEHSSNNAYSVIR